MDAIQTAIAEGRYADAARSGADAAKPLLRELFDQCGAEAFTLDALKAAVNQPLYAQRHVAEAIVAGLMSILREDADKLRFDELDMMVQLPALPVRHITAYPRFDEGSGTEYVKEDLHFGWMDVKPLNQAALAVLRRRVG